MWSTETQQHFISGHLEIFKVCVGTELKQICQIGRLNKTTFPLGILAVLLRPVMTSSDLSETENLSEPEAMDTSNTDYMEH